MTVDIARTCFTQEIRAWQGSRARTRIRWYRVLNDAPPLPFPTIFQQGLSNFFLNPPPDPPPGVPGTIISERHYNLGGPPRIQLTGPPTGSPEAWLSGGVLGVDPPLAFLPSGFSAECLSPDVEFDPILPLLFAVDVTLVTGVTGYGDGYVRPVIRGVPPPTPITGAGAGYAIPVVGAAGVMGAGYLIGIDNARIYIVVPSDIVSLLAVGMPMYGLYIPTGTTIASLAGTTVYMSQYPTGIGETYIAFDFAY